MGRPRNPKRDEARKKYLESGGQISTKDLAAAAGVPENRIRKWKSQDKWNDELKSKPKKEGASQGTRMLPERPPQKTGIKMP